MGSYSLRPADFTLSGGMQRCCSGLAARFPKSRIFGSLDRTWADPELTADVDWVPGAFMIIRRKVLSEIGLFDPTLLPLLRRDGPLSSRQVERVFASAIGPT